MPGSRTLLASALCELAALGTDRDREQLAALQDRLAAERLRVVVAGEANRGKSTLINALLGRSRLPTGVTPVTTIVTAVRYGDDPHADVRFLDGHTKSTRWRRWQTWSPGMEIPVTTAA
jgi:ribosome biogenesis GTPase A